MKRPKSTARQRGIALMMTLGVLALLLIMALAFAYTTRTERLAASVNTDLVRARLLAESGVERALAFLREQYPGNPAPGTLFYKPQAGLQTDDAWVYDPSNTPALFGRGGRYLGSVSRVVASVDGIQNHAKDALSSTIRVGGTAYQFTPSSPLYDTSTATPPGDSVGWIPVKVSHDATTDSCIGLVAYLVIDETGKIDPTQAVGGAYGISPVPTEDTSTPNTRLGLYPGELAMADCLTEQGGWSYSYGPIFGNALQSRMLNPGRWDSLYNIMNRFRLPLAPVGSLALDQQWVNRFTWSLRPFSIEEPEAYSDTSGGDLRHRCDINSIDWSNVDVENAATLFPTGSELADQPYPAGQPVGTTGVGLPWIGEIMATDPAIHNQVVANVIDFLDADVSASGAGAPPTDTENDYVPGAAGALGVATYVGLEDVPYVNEVFVRANYVEPFPSVPLPPLISFEVHVAVEADVELVNIYDTPRTVGRVNLELQVECKLTDGVTETQTVTIPYSWDGVVVPANSYVLVNTSWGTSSVLIAPVFSLAVSGGATTVAFTVTSAKVTLNESISSPTAGTLWDYAQTGPSAEAGLGVAGPAQETSVDVNDPRCNTDATQWTWNDFMPPAATPHAGVPITAGPPNSPTARNTHCTAPVTPDAPPLGSDAEDADPIDWSTAFIRNGPVVSFWELGAIHRGEPWRTLNLHSSTQAVADVGQYAYGDWPLLNQVKLTAAPDAGRGLINVWDIQPAVWKPLLQGLHLGSSYADPCGSGTELTDNVGLGGATVFMAAAGAAPTWSAAAGAVHGRAAVVLYGRMTGIDPAVVGFEDPTLDALLGTRDTDGLQEEVIGKVVGLLNDRISYYTVLVCAKAVQDVGELPAGLTAPPDDWVRYDLGPGGAIDSPPNDPARNDRYCRPMAEQKVMALVWRDFSKSQFRIISFEYLED